MPELPEVETVVRRLRPGLVGSVIVGFESRWPRQVSPDPARAAAGMLGRRVTRCRRRGKFIVLELDDASAVLVHLGMSGRLEWADGPVLPDRPVGEPPHVRAVWTLEDGRRLLLCDARKFGRIIHTRQPPEVVRRLGLEPLSRGFTAGALHERLRRRRRQIKALLLDQGVIAGLGNIYTDEALFRARLHPRTVSSRISPAQVRRLWRAIRQVLRDGIRAQGATIDWVWPGGRMQERFRVYRRAGRPCVRCGRPVAVTRVGQRSTHFCPRCQPADRSGTAASARHHGAGRVRRRMDAGEGADAGGGATRGRLGRACVASRES